ncbi:hypothetical protein NM688_g4848 [Phlebia brevispora]|uniref:Uncharacterized protein n=1 Tax=Phlebia brevispora TaxID=194682 RepID=A0ACC1T1H6_9APHY|nr:hypothetical protein NM688_g4848 [Phlebia brevispora]
MRERRTLEDVPKRNVAWHSHNNYRTKNTKADCYHVPDDRRLAPIHPRYLGTRVPSAWSRRAPSAGRVQSLNQMRITRVKRIQAMSRTRTPDVQTPSDLHTDPPSPLPSLEPPEVDTSDTSAHTQETIIGPRVGKRRT